MKSWLITITFAFCIIIFFKWLLLKTKKQQLPPGPLVVPLLGNFLWLQHSYFELNTVLRNLKLKYGPLITLRVGGSRPAIFVNSHSLAYKALIEKGAIFSDRPQGLLITSKILHSNQLNVSLSTYGPTWRLLRRNLSSLVLHHSSIKAYSSERKRVLDILVQRLVDELDDAGGVKVIDHFQYTMFYLLSIMCLGNNIQESQVKELEIVQRRLILSHPRFAVLNLFPMLGKLFFQNRWKELIQLREDQENVLVPLINARMSSSKDADDEVVAYVDTLMNLELPGVKRKLNVGEMVTLCGEFLNAGTDSTATALQWIMANLVKYPCIQDKLYKEIYEVVGGNARMVDEEDLHKMPYLKAVVLEGLRRHPPGHFLLPHAVTEDTELGGYMIPKNAIVNFMVADMGLDPNVWEYPMEFNPDRFLEQQMFDITSSKEIKMMPFGAGRRICPASALALLHLEFFVANLVWYFQWKAIEGDIVDLTEKQEFTVVLKDPLRVHLCPRAKLN